MTGERAPWNAWITGLVAAAIAAVIGSLVAVFIDLPGWVAVGGVTVAFLVGAGAVWLLRRYEPKPIDLGDVLSGRDRDQRGGGR